MTKSAATAPVQEIDTGKIDVPPHHRRIDADWVSVLTDDFNARGQLQPIEVVALTGGRFRLVYGGHRMAAQSARGLPVKAIVKSQADASDEASLRMSEIAENWLRRPNNVLENAHDLAAWRAIFEAANGAPKRGRKKAAEVDDELSANFALNFSDAAQKVLGISRRSVFLALKVASITPDAVALITGLPIANNQSELLALAEQSAARQKQIAALLADGAASVAAALSAIDKTPPPPKAEPWTRIANGFATLREQDQFRFLDANEALIDRWLAERA